MAVYAFVIAIEEYEASDTVGKTLPGTNAAAERFVQWLLEKKGVTSGSLCACAYPGFPGRTTGTTRTEIVNELARFVSEARNKVEELYVYFAGHGFSYPTRNGTGIDVLVASDFVRPADSGQACIQLQEVQEKLWGALGPGDHYYFIDACRNKIGADQIEVPTLGKVFQTSDQGRPTRYTLFSTALGEVAAVNSQFQTALLSGLNGTGRAKEWRRTRLVVTFDRLAEYVKARLPGQDVQPTKEGPNSGSILAIEPVPMFCCEVLIDGAETGEEFNLFVQDCASGLSEVKKIVGPTGSVPLRPSDYFVDINPPPNVSRLEPPPGLHVDLYQDAQVRFFRDGKAGDGEEPTSRGGEKAASEPKAAFGMERGTVHIIAGSGARIELANIDTGVSYVESTQLRRWVPPGPYRLAVTLGDRVLHNEPIQISVGARIARTIATPASASPLARLIAGHFHVDREPQLGGLAETLGPQPEYWGLPMLLSLLGAMRSTSSIEHFARFTDARLTGFETVRPGECGLQVLSAVEGGLQGRIILRRLGNGRQHPLRVVRHESIGGTELAQHVSVGAEGAALLTMRLRQRPSMTYVTHLLPNRATLVVLAEEDSKRITMHQYILPIRHLQPYMDPEVRGRWEFDSGRMLQYMYLAQERFAQKAPIESSSDSPMSPAWTDLIYRKWVDPVMSVIAAYDLVRQGFRGVEGERRRSLLTEMTINMEHYFPGIADVDAIACVVGRSDRPPDHPPLLTDGVLAFDEEQGRAMLPLPANRLDYSSPWTVWRGAVRHE